MFCGHMIDVYLPCSGADASFFVDGRKKNIPERRRLFSSVEYASIGLGILDKGLWQSSALGGFIMILPHFGN